MTQVFHLPDLGEGLTEATIIEWHVAEGDHVTIDQEVVTVETAKAAVEVPCPYAGVVTSLHTSAGAELAVGAPLITIAALADGEAYRTEERAGSTSPERPLVGYGASEAPRRARRRRGGAPLESSPEPARAAPVPSSVQSIRVISPLVRKLAADAQIDLASVTPTGEGGVIRRADVEAAVADRKPSSPAASSVASVSTPAGTPADVRIPLTGIRRAIAEKLSTSRREIPDATTWVDVDATELVATKDALKVARPQDAIGILALLARITVAGLRQFPELNSSVQGHEIVQHGQVNLGFAAQSPRGLVVPVVHDAHTMTTAELSAALRTLTEAAREGTITPAQLTGGTFTLNNYGVFGVDGSTPIINHPEAAMLGIGRIIDKPWAHEGAVALRKVTQLSFTFDHRVCDGGTAGGFLRYVADCVEQPAVLLAGL